MKKKETYYDKREIRRLGLQTYFLNLENNHFDSVNDSIIKELEKKLVNLNQKVEGLPIKEKVDCRMNIYFLEKELLAIAEMKIIYAYKHFETHLKYLLKASYRDVKDNELFKWEFVKDYLKTKKILPSEIDCFQEINELRELNNSIKHSMDIINNKTRIIKEFSNKAKLTYLDFVNFYNRIESCSYKFIFSLCEKIENDLYEYDNERLQKIAEEYALRMDKRTIEKFIDKLKQIE